MVKLKIFLGFFLGVGLYGFMSYYQPVTESYASTQKSSPVVEEELVSQRIISPLPQDFVVINTD